MKKFTISDLLLFIIWLLPIGYLAYVYAGLPAVIPIHFGSDGKPDSFGPRSEMLLIQAAISGACLLVYLLLKFLPNIDPKKQVKYGEATFNKAAFGIVSFLSLISLTVIYAVIHKGFAYDNLDLVLVSLLFIFLGNVMYNIKPNYFIGVRTPWTLESESNWKATHRVAGKIWVGGGVVLTGLMLILHGELGQTVFTTFIVLLAIIPMAYSYWYFKKHTLA